MEAEDYRHDTVFTKPSAKIPTALEPPTQPATPPPPVNSDRKKANRAVALELAATVWLGDTQHRVMGPDLFEVADAFLHYIETGERPA